MIAYKIRHIPTGLFFCPSRELKVMINGQSRYVKSNLSKTGKIYAKRPSLSFIGDRFYTHLISSFDESTWRQHKLIPYVEGEWEIIVL